VKNICDSFQITNDEYLELERVFGNLTKYASWQLLKKNTKNSHTDDFDDVNQELVMSLIRAGTYYKRQIYIEHCFEVVRSYIKDDFMLKLLEGLENLWRNRTRHGANRRKYGFYQEELLHRMIIKYVPFPERPNKGAPLKIDAKFSTYCKSIVWNSVKSVGRKITKEKNIRNGLVNYESFSGMI
jgi:hypothetical protein